MSYICDKCGTATKNGTRLTLVPVSFREVNYLTIIMKKANTKGPLAVYSEEEKELKIQEGWAPIKTSKTKGQERTGELKVCPKCN